MMIESSDSANSSSWQWVGQVAGKMRAQGMRVHNLKEVSPYDLPFGLEKMTQVAVSAFTSSLSPQTGRFKKILGYMNFKLISLASFAAYSALLVMTAVLTGLSSPFYKTSPHRRLQLYVRLLGVYTFDSLRKLPIVFEVEALIRSAAKKRQSLSELQVHEPPPAPLRKQKKDKKQDEDWLQKRSSSVEPFTIDSFTSLQGGLNPDSRVDLPK